MLSKRELYNEIIRLRQQGKTYREIAKILHVSPSQISAALKEFEGTNTEPSQTKAYRMFLKGKRPIDVAIALGIGDEQTTRFWKEYLILTGHYRLLKIGEELKGKFQSFFNIYNAIKRKGLTIEEVEEQVKRAREFNFELTDKEKRSIELNEQIKQQEDTISKLNIEISVLSIVKLFLTQVVKNLAREKRRLEFLPSCNANYNYERNNQFIPIYPGSQFKMDNY
jgi:transcriptional regulator with XRE-family HTH domain